MHKWKLIIVLFFLLIAMGDASKNSAGCDTVVRAIGRDNNRFDIELGFDSYNITSRIHYNFEAKGRSGEHWHGIVIVFMHGDAGSKREDRYYVKNPGSFPFSYQGKLEYITVVTIGIYDDTRHQFLVECVSKPCGHVMKGVGSRKGLFVNTKRSSGAFRVEFISASDTEATVFSRYQRGYLGFLVRHSKNYIEEYDGFSSNVELDITTSSSSTSWELVVQCAVPKTGSQVVIPQPKCSNSNYECNQMFPNVGPGTYCVDMRVKAGVFDISYRFGHWSNLSGYGKDESDGKKLKVVYEDQVIFEHDDFKWNRYSDRIKGVRFAGNSTLVHFNVEYKNPSSRSLMVVQPSCPTTPTAMCGSSVTGTGFWERNYRTFLIEMKSKRGLFNLHYDFGNQIGSKNVITVRRYSGDVWKNHMGLVSSYKTIGQTNRGRASIGSGMEYDLIYSSEDSSLLEVIVNNHKNQQSSHSFFNFTVDCPNSYPTTCSEAPLYGIFNTDENIRQTVVTMKVVMLHHSARFGFKYEDMYGVIDKIEVRNAGKLLRTEYSTLPFANLNINSELQQVLDIQYDQAKTKVVEFKIYPKPYFYDFTPFDQPSDYPDYHPSYSFTIFPTCGRYITPAPV